MVCYALTYRANSDSDYNLLSVYMSKYFLLSVSHKTAHKKSFIPPLKNNYILILYVLTIVYK